MTLRLVATITLAVAGLVAVPGSADAAVPGSISGIVRADGLPMADAYVMVIQVQENGIYGRGPLLAADTITGPDGSYTIELPPSGADGYSVCFVDPNWPFSDYDGQCDDQVDGFAPFPSGAGFLDTVPGSKKLLLTAGQHLTGVNADLHRYLGANGGVAGKVTQFGLLPLKGVFVVAKQGGVPVLATYSAGNGTYRITGLPPGSYQVCFSAAHPTCRKALVVVRTGVVTKGVNGVLSTKS
ncbi:MAG: SdrD B-like domain [Pseudonocardiales bacterium]|nr:SdrD B-like domain [Pseudonocardiales bacterium]